MTPGAFVAPLLAVKLGLYVFALLAAGLALHAALRIIEDAGRPRALRWASVFALIAFALAALRLLLTSAELGGGLEYALDPGMFAWVWPAQSASVIAAAVGAGALLAARFMQRAVFAGLGALVLAASFALTGHTQALETPGFSPAIAGLHVLIAGLWISAPVSLWPHASLSDLVLAARLKRFSAFALLAVPVLILAGAWLAWTLAGGLTPLISSLYGKLLLAKLAAAALALALGAINKLMVTGLIDTAPARGRAWLKATLALDALLFFAALVLIGLATTITGPPEG